MPGQLNPQAAADNWANGLGAATNKIKAGIQSLTVSPTQQAAARVDAWAQGVQRAAADGSFQRGCQSVSLADWQNAVITKGLPILASRAAAAKPSYVNFAQKFFPHLQAGVAALGNMPRGTLEQNIARAVAMMQHNANFSMT